jgi:hypothetical protein
VKSVTSSTGCSDVPPHDTDERDNGRALCNSAATAGAAQILKISITFTFRIKFMARVYRSIINASAWPEAGAFIVFFAIAEGYLSCVTTFVVAKCLFACKQPNVARRGKFGADFVNLRVYAMPWGGQCADGERKAQGPDTDGSKLRAVHNLHR